MKKIISIILVLCMLLLLTACDGDSDVDKSIYASEDWSYLMVYGIKYVKVEQPFTIGYNNSGESNIWYNQRTNTGLWVFNYEGTQRYPWTWFSYDCFRLYDVLLPNDINIKFLDECGSYCLPEDKETVENIFSNVSWSEESILCDLNTASPQTPLVPLSKELSRVLTSACDSFLMRDKLFTFEEAKCIMDLYQYDDQGIFRRVFASVYARGDKFYVFPAESLLRFSSEGELADYTWEDLSSQKIPEEFHDEIMTLYDTYKDTNP